MTNPEKRSVQQLSETQAVMREKQHNMQEDINELKALVKATNQQLFILNQKFDELSGAKRTIIWLTGVALTVTGLIIAWINSHKS